MREERFPTPGPIRLDCSVTSGTVTIETADVTEAKIGLDGARELVDVMRVELVGDRLIVSEPKTSFLNLVLRPSESLQLVAQLPHGSSVAVKAASSDMALDGTFGDIEVQSASGDLRVTGEVEGNASAKSASGDVRLPRVRGDLDVRGVSGDLRVDSVDGSVSVTSVSGEVQIESLREGSVSIRSVSGDVQLGIEPGSNVDVDATSASGRLVSEVPLSDSPTPGSNPTVVIRGMTASGDVRVFRAASASMA